MKLAAVIPCFRVRQHIVEVVDRVLPYVDHVFVVDDCCPELSGDLVAVTFPPNRVTVLRHPENRGVGGATVTGYRAAFAAGYDVFIKIDGDGQMDPAHIPDLVHPIISQEADYTKGNRFYRREHLVRMPKVRLFGNSVLSLSTKISSGYWNIMDPTNGYTALHSTAAQEIDLAKVDRRYFFESDMLFRLNVARAVVKDVPMPAIYGTEKSNLPIGYVMLEFPAKHIKNLLKRFSYNYLIRDFSVGTIQIIAGASLTVFGVIFGAISWMQSAAASRDTPVGTVMLATLPIILGFQLLLAALSFDIANVPSRPLQRILRPRAWRSGHPTASDPTTALSSQPDFG
jgi:dolichol-phosphate mannosyltransferase